MTERDSPRGPPYNEAHDGKRIDISLTDDLPGNSSMLMTEPGELVGCDHIVWLRGEVVLSGTAGLTTLSFTRYVDGGWSTEKVINSGLPLSDSTLYLFKVPVEPGESFNLRVGAGGGIGTFRLRIFDISE